MGSLYPRMTLSPQLAAAFDSQSRTRIIFGAGTVARLGVLARELGMRRALLVTDAGIVAAGHADRAEPALASAGVELIRYEAVRENPTTLDVSACLEVARNSSIDGFIGLGGGSSMDTAKGANFLLTNGGEMKDYWGVGKARFPLLPLIAVPTTAGTGSECQSAALIADPVTHQKMACLDPKAAARIALLDPELTLSMPPRVTAVTGVDAIAHALETAVTTRRTPWSLIYSRAAFGYLVSAFPRVLANPRDIEARSEMLLGSAFAGLAIENSMLGAVHSAANPLTAHFGIAHGVAVGLMLPSVLRFNAVNPQARSEYAGLLGTAGVVESEEVQVERLMATIDVLLSEAGIPKNLAVAGVSQDSVPGMAMEAAQQWTAKFNPRSLTIDDFIGIYHAAGGWVADS